MSGIRTSLTRLLRDTDGGTTAFGLFVTVIFLIVGGMAVDTARLVSARTQLQIAADNAAQAAIIKTFKAVPGETGAVRVTTGSTSARGAGINTLLLKLSGVPRVDLETRAIFVTGGGTGCIYALDDSGKGIEMSGGTNISAPECSVISNAVVKVPCGTTITTKQLVHDDEVDDCQWSEAIVDAQGERAPRRDAHTDDPLAGNAQVRALHARFQDIRYEPWPAALSVASGTDINFGWSDLKKTEEKALADSGCTAERDEGKWTVTCTGSEINLGGIGTGGGITVDFNSGGDPATVYNFSGTLTHGGGSSLTFGSGTFNLGGGIKGADFTFGSGSFHIGEGSEGCKYSICVTGGGKVTFDGSSDFILDSGMSIGGGGTVKFGVGSSDNTFVLGETSKGVSMVLNGSDRVEFGDAIGVDVGLRVRGEVKATGGGSCVVFPKTANHDLLGGVNLSGAAVMGAGIYHVDGSFRAGTGGANCTEDKVAVSGTDVTVVISGVGASLSGGKCPSGSSFCVGGGNAVTLTAPSTGANALLGIIGPLDEGSGGAYISAGGSSRLSGVMYFPNDPIEMNGGATIGGSSETDCLQIIGSEILMSGGTAAASECIDMAASGRIQMVD
ncbi:MAG: pilus assembly protein TadG-related protein [Maritimibacter sp.]